MYSYLILNKLMKQFTYKVIIFSNSFTKEIVFNRSKLMSGMASGNNIFFIILRSNLYGMTTNSLFLSDILLLYK